MYFGRALVMNLGLEGWSRMEGFPKWSSLSVYMTMSFGKETHPDAAYSY